MQILSSLHFPHLLKIFKKVFLLCISHIDQRSFNTLNKKDVEGLKLKGQQEMKKVSFCQRSLCIHVCQFHMKEAVLSSPWRNFKLFTLLLKGVFLSCYEFSHIVPNYNLHIVNNMPPWKLSNPHFLALMRP